LKIARTAGEWAQISACTSLLKSIVADNAAGQKWIPPRAKTESRIQSKGRDDHGLPIRKQTEALSGQSEGQTGKISDKTHEEHSSFTGYINKTNAILKELERWQRRSKSSQPRAREPDLFEIRSRKVDFTFALGGVINHELYFNNLGGKGGPATAKSRS
jgi:hypothetical protein